MLSNMRQGPISVTIKKGQADLFYTKGLDALKIGHLDYAIEFFFEAIKLEPRHLEARRNLRITQLRKHETKGKRPLIYFIALATSLPSLILSHHRKASDPLSVLLESERQLQATPLNRHWLKLFCDAALLADMPMLAIQTLEIAVQHRPNDLLLRKWLGELYLNADSPHLASDCYSAAIRLNPSDNCLFQALQEATILASLKEQAN